MSDKRPNSLRDHFLPEGPWMRKSILWFSVTLAIGLAGITVLYFVLPSDRDLERVGFSVGQLTGLVAMAGPGWFYLRAGRRESGRSSHRQRPR
ncbi:MAG: hypothetical protein RL215_1211 [Planctomycetota bacterium]